LSVALASLLAASAQQPGQQDSPPTVRLTECTTMTQCTNKDLKVTLDANWRWTYKQGGYENCYEGSEWDSRHCTDPVQCATQCELEGLSTDKYKNTYGIEQIQNGVKLNFVTDHEYGTNVGSRLYMLDESGQKYKMFYLKNREFAMTFDVSAAYCGMNGAMYFVEMDQEGGKGLGANNAGAAYGTGYCDAQCPHDMKWISGEANTVEWVQNPNDPFGNMGQGKYGACCAEMDIWEANSMANAYTPHPCDFTGQLRCEGTDCGDNAAGERYDGVCDKDGCDMHPYRLGNRMFFGRGSEYEVDTTKPMTVVTQFLTTDGTDDGDLSEIVRYYVQDGNVIASPSTTLLGPDDSDRITDGWCQAAKTLFGDVDDYTEKGGTAAMGESLNRGHVMAISLWDDVEVNMLWLDSAFPLDKPATDPGVQRGDCPGGEESTPAYLRQNFPESWVSFQNAFVGPIGSFLSHPTQAPTPGTTPSPSPGGSGCCRFGADCGDCGEDGTGWCHQSSSNCATCTGIFDPTGTPPPACGGSPTPGPPPPPATCSDGNQLCPGWAASGECQRNPGWMLENCRLSCGNCPTTPTPAPCTDNNAGCAAWAASGECQANPGWMLENCCQSCGGRLRGVGLASLKNTKKHV